MKKYNNIFIAFILIAAMAVSSCDWIDPDINVSPNSPTDVNMSDLLPQVQTASAFTKGGDLARFSTIPMQHLSGVNRQSFAFERYVINESDVNNLWSTSYASVMNNAQIIIDKAEASNAPYYAGIAKTLMAYRLGIISAVWGDVPYSQALQGFDNLIPAYDSQESVYQSVNALLTSAIADFATGGGDILPGGDDLIFGGNTDQWSRTAASLRARFALHLSNRNGYQAVLSALNADVIASNDDNAAFHFGNAVTERNPIYQFDDQRTDIRVSSTIVNMMNGTDDPRRSAYFTTVDGAFVGADPGSGTENASFVGPHYAATNAPVYFMTYAETKFIEAEALHETGDLPGAAAAYNEAVAASLAQHGASDAAWEAVNANEDAGSISLETIIEGKYIALFTDSEVWADWRRTGFPNLEVAPNPATADGQIPRRFVYPLGERLYNGNNMPSGLTSSDRVWWDVD